MIFIVRYANLWRSYCRRRRGCLSSPMTIRTTCSMWLKNCYISQCCLELSLLTVFLSIVKHRHARPQ